MKRSILTHCSLAFQSLLGRAVKALKDEVEDARAKQRAALKFSIAWQGRPIWNTWLELLRERQLERHNGELQKLNRATTFASAKRLSRSMSLWRKAVEQEILERRRQQALEEKWIKVQGRLQEYNERKR